MPAVTGVPDGKGRCCNFVAGLEAESHGIEGKLTAAGTKKVADEAPTSP